MANRAARSVALLLALAVSAMHEPADSSLAVPTVVVLVTLDGVRRQDVFERPDVVPNLSSLGATMGCSSRLSASGPDFVSLPGYMELLTGRRKHGCFSNDCSPPMHDTLVDDFARASSRLGDVAVFASWPPLGTHVAHSPRALVSAGRDGTNYPAMLRADDAFEDGERAEAYPGHDRYRPDRFTAAIATRYLRERTPRFMFLALGDTDEHAHRNDVDAYLAALRFADGVIGEIAATLAELEKRGMRTLLVVTTDHGRSHSFAAHGRMHPESADVWLVASGHGVKARGCVSTAGERRLADVAPTVRALAGMPTDGRVLVELFESP